MTEVVAAIHPYWDMNRGRNRKGGWNEPKLKEEFRRLFMQAIDERRRPISLPDFAARVNVPARSIQSLYSNYKWFDEIRESRKHRISTNEDDIQERLQDQKLRVIRLNGRTLRRLELCLGRLKKKDKDGNPITPKEFTAAELLSMARTAREIHNMLQLELHEPTNVTHNREIKVIIKAEAAPYETGSGQTRTAPPSFTVATGGCPSPREIQGSGRGKTDQEDGSGPEISSPETPSVARGERGVVSRPGEEAGEAQRVEKGEESLSVAEPLAAGGEAERERPDDSNSGEQVDEARRLQGPGVPEG